ncbi:MAG: hypothetical protein JJU06_10330 [Ectothiorhodospiraceae bacterium]|nr:hypothetical protein [Ectothiorhodospiraceae bacterium]MCH8503050.1 hypothetical protein [Ectothiorhodospiraceae bacterium]
MSLGAGVGAPYLLYLDVRDSRAAIDQQLSFFLSDSAVAIFTVAPLGGAAMLLLASGGIYRLTTNQPPPKWIGKSVTRVAGILLLVTLIAMLPARYAGNVYWHAQIRDTGYVQCPKSLTRGAQWNTIAWARDPDYCRDPHVRYLYLNSTNRMEEINAYLRRR